jgi:hypothetical protein
MKYLGLQMLQDENASRHLEVLLIFQQLGEWQRDKTIVV